MLGVIDIEGVELALGDNDTEGVILTPGVVDTLTEGVTLSLGVTETDGVVDTEMLGVTEIEGVTDTDAVTEGVTEILGVKEGENCGVGESPGNSGCGASKAALIMVDFNARSCPLPEILFW